MKIEFNLNGSDVAVDTAPGRLLVELLREELGLTGTKVGCGVGECGACTVLLDGRSVNSCLIPAASVAGHRVLTIEGVSPQDGPLHPIQQAFIDAGAVQCGYCIPGMVLSAKALLDRERDPTEPEIAEAMSGNLCRCTGYQKILDGVRLAAARLSRREAGGADGTEA